MPCFYLSVDFSFLLNFLDLQYENASHGQLPVSDSKSAEQSNGYGEVSGRPALWNQYQPGLQSVPETSPGDGQQVGYAHNSEGQFSYPLSFSLSSFIHVPACK